MSLFSKHKDAYKQAVAPSAELEEGTYLAQIGNVTSDFTGTDAKFKLLYLVRQHIENPMVDMGNTKVWKNYSMSEQGVVWFMKDLEQMGFNLDSYETLEDLARDLFQTKGQYCVLYIKPKEYKGKMYPNAYLNEWDVDPNMYESGSGLPSVNTEEELPF